MLITEQQLSHKNDFDLLESISYIDAPSIPVLLHSIPVIESQGNYLVDLNDIIEISQLTEESDMGMVLHSICECNNINPNSVELFINGYKLLESDDISNIVSGLIHNGVEVYQKPLNENNTAYLLADTAVDEYAYTGDSSLLEEFITDEFLNESNYQRRLETKAKKSAYVRALAANGDTEKLTTNSGINKVLAKLYDKKKDEFDTEETKNKVAKYYESDKEHLDTKGREKEKRMFVTMDKDTMLSYARDAIAYTYPTGSKEFKDSHEKLKELEREFNKIPKNNYQERRAFISKIQDFKNDIYKVSAARVDAKKVQDEEKKKMEASKNEENNKSTFSHKGSLVKRLSSGFKGVKKQAKSIADTVKNEPEQENQKNDTSSETKQGQPTQTTTPNQVSSQAQQQIQNTIQKAEKEAENKPKSWLAQKIYALRQLYAKWLKKKNEEHESGKIGIISNILRIIAKGIDWLLKKLQNFVD